MPSPREQANTADRAAKVIVGAAILLAFASVTFPNPFPVLVLAGGFALVGGAVGER